MLRINPVSLNALSYDAVVRILSSIQRGNNISVCNSSSHTVDNILKLAISVYFQDFPTGDPPILTDIFIDTVGDPEFYKSRLTSALGKDFGRFVIEKKADATYKVVSAASIIAKVTSKSCPHNRCYHFYRNVLK